MIKILALFLLSGAAYSASNGGDHHGGPADLIWPAINLTILFTALFIKLRKPIVNMFADKSTTIKDQLEVAAVKAKEANLMREMQEKKMKSSEEEIKKLEEEANDLISQFEKNYKHETDQKINNLKEDAGMKIEAEKKELLDNLNSKLLAEVIANAKSQINKDNSLEQKATNNILQGLK